MALFKNRILAGSIKTFAKGIRWLETRKSTPCPIISVKAATNGPITFTANNEIPKPTRPAENC